jgi:hypothetical protein
MATVLSITEFLESRASSTALNAQQIEALVSELNLQVNQLSVSVPGASESARILLFSGLMPHGGHTGEVASLLAEETDNGLKVISQTEVFQLLDEDNDRFHAALRAALGPNSDAAYALVVNGEDINGNRISSDSLWDSASRRFAENASGDVRVLAPVSDLTRVFAQTEIPALLNNANVTHIEGIAKEDLIRIRDSLG